MRQLPEDRQRFLVTQHRASQSSTLEPLRPVQTGPAHASESGLLSNVKRFSLASVGWGGYAAPSIESEPSPTPVRPATTFGGEAMSPGKPSAQVTRAASTATPHLQSQETGTSSSWTSWWSSPSNATGIGQSTSEQAKDSPQFYRDQLRSTYVLALAGFADLSADTCEPLVQQDHASQPREAPHCAARPPLDRQAVVDRGLHRPRPGSRGAPGPARQGGVQVGQGRGRCAERGGQDGPSRVHPVPAGSHEH